MRNSNASGAWRRSNPRTTRLRRSRAIARSVTTPKLPVSTTSTSVWSASAAANVSNPGPRLADEAGTRTTRRRSIRAGTLDGRRAAHERPAGRVGLALELGEQLRDRGPVAAQHLGALAVRRVRGEQLVLVEGGGR